MNLQTAADIPLQITSENASAERRITPSWSVAHLKTKLESVTGIPPSSQKLTLRLPDREGVAIEAEDEDGVQLVRWPLQPYAEIHVCSRDICLDWGGLLFPSPYYSYELCKTLFPGRRFYRASFSLRLSSTSSLSLLLLLGAFSSSFESRLYTRSYSHRIASHSFCPFPPPPPLSLPTPSPPTHTHQPKLTPLSPHQVTDTRPPTSRFHIPSPTSVPKYTMPPSEYATRPDSVLAWKKAHRLGRFDPHAPDAERAKVEAGEREIRERG